MGRPAQDITESELAVLRILWDRETSTIRQLTDVLYPQGEAAQYATVQKLLDRMEAKGYVRRDRTMFVHVFRSVSGPRRADRPPAPFAGRDAVRGLAHAALDAPGAGQGPDRRRPPGAAGHRRRA